MDINESQLSYLDKRNKEYDRKYGMVKELLGEIGDVDSVLELFGGTGIESSYIDNLFHPSKHIVLDKNEGCYKILKSRGFDALNIDCFDYDNNDKFDLLVIDSVFNNRVYDLIVSLINKFNFKSLLLTNTGVFNVRFNKELSYEKYWNTMIDRIFKDTGISNIRTIYDYDFGIMLLINDSSPVYNYEKNSYKDMDWRKYREEILNIENNT